MHLIHKEKAPYRYEQYLQFIKKNTHPKSIYSFFIVYIFSVQQRLMYLLLLINRK